MEQDIYLGDHLSANVGRLAYCSNKDQKQSLSKQNFTSFRWSEHISFTVQNRKSGNQDNV
jgi:hypothetical protein